MTPDAKGELANRVPLTTLCERLDEVLPVKLRDCDVYEISPPIDSSDMKPETWNKLAQCVDRLYDAYQGFVMIHGTDTLAYTAAALTFLLPGLAKPIIITGAQKSIFAMQSDAITNIRGAVQAAISDISGVFVFFHTKLMHGSSVVKVHANDYDAFDCPKRASAAAYTDGDGMLVLSPEFFFANKHHRQKKSDKRMKCHQIHVKKKVAILRLYPGVDLDLSQFLPRKILCIVIQSLGSGNGPSTKLTPEFSNSIISYLNDGGKVVFVTECAGGAVGESYETGLGNIDPRIIPLKDMTVEAAFAKATVYLNNPRCKNWGIFASHMQKSAGEMCAAMPRQFSFEDQWDPRYL